MENRKHVLVIANNVSSTEIECIKNSVKEMENKGLQIIMSGLYVKPFLPSFYFHIPSMMDLADEMEHQAEHTLKTLSLELNMLAENQWISSGKIKNEALELAASLGVDYILASADIHKHISQHASCRKFHRQTPPIKVIEAQGNMA